MALTRSDARLWMSEMPVGDPFGGPAYGKREDPVTAMIAASAVSAVSTIASSEQQAQQMRLQAQQAELQGRQNALNYNRQANQVLARQQQLAGMARARAAAGGVDPLTGSPMTIQQIDAMKANQEFGIAKENAQMAIYGSLAESQSLQSAADFTQTMGYVNAAAKFGQGYSSAQSYATPSSPAPVRVVS